jgi:catechol 2,3-dioxygenase-like lactoylglutathione lyase family enzyme
VDAGLGFGSVQRISVDRANTVLYCDQWEATASFYRNVLALDVEHESDWFVEFRLTDTAFVSIADARRATIDAVGGQGITLTLHTTALIETKALLDRSGITTTSIKRRWGADVFYCRDPEGHRIEFWAQGT